jgi:hypothetical protein
VVAEEVRNLAARSAAAAKETGKTAGEARAKVTDGTAIAESTAVAFTEILTEAGRAADIAGELAGAYTEQASGIAALQGGLHQLDSRIRDCQSRTNELTGRPPGSTPRRTRPRPAFRAPTPPAPRLIAALSPVASSAAAPAVTPEPAGGSWTLEAVGGPTGGDMVGAIMDEGDDSWLDAALGAEL